MPPYDRRSRQRGFNTRIPIYTLSGGVGRQAPSKRLPSESQVIDNAVPTLERSIEKRSCTEQLSCYRDIASDTLSKYGSLPLPNGVGGTGTIEPLVASGQSATAKLVFSGSSLLSSTLSLTSSDATNVVYLVDDNANSGYYTESSAVLEFLDSPAVDGTITFISADGTSKTYIAKADGTVTDGTLDVSGNVQFNNGSGKTASEKANSAAKHLQAAIYSAQGHNNNASTSLEFTATAQVDETITLTSTDGTEITYIGKSSGTSGDKSGTNVLFNVGASASDSATALAAAINSTNGHNAANTVATATWTFNAACSAGDTIQLLGTTNLGTTVSKTFKAATSGSNGDLDGSDVIFLADTDATTQAANLEAAINNKNGVGTTGWMTASSNASAAKATAVLTFTDAATANASVNIVDYKGIARLYTAKDLAVTSTDFTRGSDRVASARAFAAVVNSSGGHNGTILATYNSSGEVTLTQQAPGTAGNTSITPSIVPGWAINCTTPAAFTGGTTGGDVTVTQGYAGAYGNTTITDSAGFAGACSVAPPAAFTGGADTGVNGTKFTTTVSTAEITIAQVAEGFGATERIKLSAKFTDSVTGSSNRPSPRFGKLHAEIVGKTGKILLSQCVDGDTGNKSITTNVVFSKSPLTVSSAFTRSSNTYVNSGTSANDAADHLKTAITSDYGHNGKLTASVASDQITITQAVTGKAGNTGINYGKNYSSKLSTKPVVFSGGAEYNVLLDSQTIVLTDIKNKQYKIKFNSNVKKENSTADYVGTKDVTTAAQLAEAIVKAVNAHKIRMTAEVVDTSKVVLSMDDRGGNGIPITANSTYFKSTSFTGSMPEHDLFYYWYSISDDFRYLLVVDYNAVKGADELFYVFKVETATGKVENQTPPLQNQPAETVYNYITHKNDTKTAQEALEAITVGTNIYILNKFVKAGFSSNANGYKFDLDGNVLTDTVDYKGKEVTYYTSAVVDPEGKALIYVPNKSYIAGTEVYNAYGVWKALADIRSESTNQFSGAEDEETIIPADPGPPEFSYVSADTDRWYAYGYNGGNSPDPTAGDPDGLFRRQWQTGDPEGEVDGVYLPTPSVLEDGKYYWKETVSSSSGIVETEGDIVYDIAHSRRTCDSSISGTDCHSDGVDYYVSLWQYVRPVEQIPVEDNRYVDLTKQYLGQSYTDFSNVKLPPHPSDINDIIDKVDEICKHPNNLTGDAARTIGILYEGRSETDYYPDPCPAEETPSKNHTTNDYGLGKILYVEGSYAGTDPGFYRIDSVRKPYIQKIRTPFKFSRFDEDRLPHKMTFSSTSETGYPSWNLAAENWFMRTSGDEDTNPGPKLFEEGRQAEIKAMGFFRNRLWFAGEDKVFSSRLNEINNLWITDPASLTDEDPIDVTCSYNKYTEVTSLTPFESYLFINTGSDVQFTLAGSDNLVTPFTAEISPTSFYSTAPLVNPVLLGSQIYFFDNKRLYVYFNEKTVSINNAIEVSYHCPDYLPTNYGSTAVVSSYDTVLFTDKDKPTDMYCYTNRYSGDQVIQNAFFRYIFDKPIETINNWDNDIYTVVKRDDGYGNTLYHVEKQKFFEDNLKLPLVDHRKSIQISSLNTSFNRDKDETTFTFEGYFNPDVDALVIIDDKQTVNIAGETVDGEPLDIISVTATSTSTKIVVNGNYAKLNNTYVYVGTKYKTEVELSPQFYRDDTNNVVDGILSLRTMHIRHHKTGNYRVEVTNRGRVTTPIEFSSKEISKRTDPLPLESYVLDGETVSKILGFGDEVKISLISDYISPMNITNIELKGRFNATYSSWVR